MTSGVDRLLEEFRGKGERVEKLLLLVDDLLKECRFSSALETADSILGLVPGHVEGQLLRARSLRGLSRYQEAAAACESVIDDLGEFEPALELLAEVHACQENWVLMQSVSQRGLDQADDPSLFRLLLAEALYNRREYDEVYRLLPLLPSLEVAPVMQAERLAILHMHCQMLPDNESDLQNLIRRRPEIMVLRYHHHRLFPGRDQSSLRLAELAVEHPVYQGLAAWGKIRWHQLRGLMLLDLEQIPEAGDEFAEVIRRWPESPTAMSAWADGMLHLQAWSESRSRLLDWQAQRPEESQLVDALCGVLAAMDDRVELDQVLERVTREMPDHPRFPIMRAEFLHHQGRRLEAWGLLRKTAEQFPLIPGIRDLLLDQAALLEDPEPFLEQIAQLQHEADLGNHESLVAFHGRMWQWLENRGNLEVALEHLRQVQSLREETPLLQMAEVRLLMQLEDRETALSRLNRVQPLLQEEWREKVRLLHLLEESEAARTLLVRQRKNVLDEMESPARVAAGWLELTREIDGAEAALDWAETLDPDLRNDPEFLAVWIHILRHEGRFLDVLGLLAGNEEIDDDYFNREKAICLFNCGRGEEAREIIFAERQDIHDPAGWHWRAQVLHYLGRPLEAMGAVEEGLRIDPQHGELLKQRVILLEAMGDPAAVVDGARLGLVRQPDDPDLQRQLRVARFFSGDRSAQLKEYWQKLSDGDLDPQEYVIILQALMDGCPKETWQTDPPVYLLKLADDALAVHPEADVLHEFRIHLLLRLGGQSPVDEKKSSLYDRIRAQLESFGLLKRSNGSPGDSSTVYAERLVQAITEWEKRIPDSPRLYLWNMSRMKTGEEIATSLVDMLRKAHAGELHIEKWEVLDWFIIESRNLGSTDYGKLLKDLELLVGEGHDFNFLGQLIFFSSLRRRELIEGVERWLRFNGFSGGLDERAAVRTSPGENRRMTRTRVLVETISEIVGESFTGKVFLDYLDDPYLLDIWRLQSGSSGSSRIDASLDEEYLLFLLQSRTANPGQLTAHFELLREELQKLSRVIAYVAAAWLELNEPAKACRLLYPADVHRDSPEWLLEVQVRAQVRAGLVDKATALVESLRSRPEAGLHLWMSHLLAVEKKDWPAAERFLDECADVRPVSDRQRGQFCAELIMAGELEHGERLARERLEHSPTMDSRLLVSLIQVAMDRGEYTRALSLLDRLEAPDQALPVIILIRARALAFLERWREARWIVRATLVRDDVDAETRLGLAVVMALMQEADSVVEILQEPWKRHDADPDLWLQGMHGLLQCALHRELDPMVQAFRQRFPDHPALPELDAVILESRNEQAEVLIAAAREADPSGEPDDVAIRALQAKLAGMVTYPRDSAWLPLQGELIRRLYLTGRLREAETAWQRIPSSIRPLKLQSLGVLTALKRGELRTALARLEEWSILAPDEPGIPGFRALLHLRLGEVDQALQSLDLVSPDGSHPEDDLFRALLHCILGDREQSRRLLRKASRKLSRRRKGREESGESPLEAWMRQAIAGLRGILDGDIDPRET